MMREYVANTLNKMEIMLPCNEELTFTCVLASLNVAKYDEWKDTDLVEVATEFLNAVCDEFIEKGRHLKGLEKAVRFTEKYKAIGIGVTGFHTYLQKHGMAFSEMPAHLFNLDLFKTIRQRAEKQSKGRNASLIAVAPTKSTSIIMGGVSEGINPDPAMVYIQSSAGGEFKRINPNLLEIMKEKGKNTKDVVDDILNHGGSVQHVDWLDEEQKKVFRTAFEINQSSVIRLASARAKYIDQWQSVNLFFPANAAPSTIAQIHKEAFLDENIRGLYYIYSSIYQYDQSDVCEACSI